MKPEQAFGIVIRKHRRMLGFSQEELSYMCDLDRTFISLLERGLRKPTLNTILTLSESLKLRASVLVKEVEETLDENKTGQDII